MSDASEGKAGGGGSASVRECVSCTTSKTKGDFSANQWKKAKSKPPTCKACTAASEAKQQEGGAGGSGGGGGGGGGSEDAKQEQDDGEEDEANLVGEEHDAVLPHHAALLALPPGVLGLAVEDADREAVVALDARLEAEQTPYRNQATYEMKVRFIRARKYEVKKAHKMIADHLMWRDLHKPGTITQEDIMPALASRCWRFMGTTHDESPVLWIQAGMWNPHEYSTDVYVKCAFW